ncbi:hypothetical protein MHZ90_17355 [Pantoea sp. ACRSH]|uniref:hypothetical protein n=1 Tax=unclassified Pantoea TaxID=2630326 RepID=UPI001EF61691|nr:MULTISPECIES: hypothetical protein [unclassified Pantoea]MCG7367883.1 hypothetical protein [Pantoea sp. ACRSH]MCG7398242.1 hypothetical protein [Pantoea sp. ACRSC]
MSSFKLVSTLKFVNSNGHAAKYEIYYDLATSEHHADIFHIASTTSQGLGASMIEVWHKIHVTYQRIPGNTLRDIEDSCLNHFLGK